MIGGDNHQDFAGINITPNWTGKKLQATSCSCRPVKPSDLTVAGATLWGTLESPTLTEKSLVAPL